MLDINDLKAIFVTWYGRSKLYGEGEANFWGKRERRRKIRQKTRQQVFENN